MDKKCPLLMALSNVMLYAPPCDTQLFEKKPKVLAKEQEKILQGILSDLASSGSDVLTRKSRRKERRTTLELARPDNSKHFHLDEIV